MRFFLLDRIESVEPGVRLVGTKNVSYSEDYIHDHFPEFPVLPGVFMLEAATQAAAWLLRITENYAHSVIILREAKNIKYASFVAPGQKLRVEVEQLKCDDRFATFKVDGLADGQSTLTGRIVLERYNLTERGPEWSESDARIISFMRKAEKAISAAGSNSQAAT